MYSIFCVHFKFGISVSNEKKFNCTRAEKFPFLTAFLSVFSVSEVYFVPHRMGCKSCNDICSSKLEK